MLPLRFDRFMCRRYEGHPTTGVVDMFWKRGVGGDKYIYTQSFKRDFTLFPANMVVVSANPTITKGIVAGAECISEDCWLTVPKHIAGVMRIDMVILLNTYCDMKTRDQIWDLQYYTPPVVPVVEFRKDLQLFEAGGEEA